MAKIGFIGLGIMGRPMAGRLIEGGHELFVHSRRAAPKELTDKGAVACANGREVARNAETIIAMVPDTPDVEAVAVRRGRGRGGAVARQDRGRHELDLADRHQGIRGEDQRARLRLSRRAGFRRRGRSESGQPHDHGRRAERPLSRR